MTDPIKNRFALSDMDIALLACFVSEVTEVGGPDNYRRKLELDRYLGLALLAAEALLAKDLTFNMLIAPDGLRRNFGDALHSLNGSALACANEIFFHGWQAEHEDGINALHGLSVWLDVNSKRLSSQQFFLELMRTAEEVSRVAKAQPQIRALGHLTVSLHSSSSPLGAAGDVDPENPNAGQPDGHLSMEDIFRLARLGQGVKSNL